jgi:hypothetical protein
MTASLFQTQFSKFNSHNEALELKDVDKLLRKPSRINKAKSNTIQETNDHRRTNYNKE